MPKTAGDGHAKRDELPSTLQRSGRKAQETFAQTHDSALTEYHDEQRANRVAYAALMPPRRRSTCRRSRAG